MTVLNKFSSYLVAFIIFMAPVFVFSQNTVCLGDDAEICVGTDITIEPCGPGTGITNSVIELTNPSSETLDDDDYTAAINIGFDFTFYGNVYNQCVVGDNGIVSFDVANNASGYCAYSTSAFPTTNSSSILNCITAPWQDLYLPVGGLIYYETVGTAPNRIFVVSFDGVSMFSSDCQTPDQCYTGAVLLFEGSNRIETHIANKTTCEFWGDGTAVHGVQNIDGTIAHTVPGRNNTIWTAQNDGWEFVPTSANSYDVNQIPYKLIALPSGDGIVWYNTNGDSFPYNNGSLSTTVESGVIGYYLASSTCDVGVGAVSDTSWITGISSSVSASAVDDFCSAGVGSVTATPTSGAPIYTFDWPTLGSTEQVVNGVFAGTYTVNMTDGNGCVSSATVDVGDTPAIYQATSTIISCPGGNNGTAFAEMVPELGNITYQWDDPMGQTTQTAVGLSAGTYNCTITSDVGCNGVATIEVDEIPGMIANIADQSNVTCHNASDGVIDLSVSQGTPPYSYSWNRSTSTTNTATDLSVGSHTIIITDDNGCIISIDGNLTEPNALDITFLTPQTQICPEDNILLSVIGEGGSSTKTFTWYQAGNILGTGDQILVDPEVTNMEYCVTLSEECGSPSDSECTMITFPTPIEPSAKPDFFSKCVPNTFEFTNTSTNPTEIESTYWEYGDNITHTELVEGNDPTSHYYYSTGLQTITMTTTSIFGCVYTDTLHDLIEVIPSPVADFNFSSNPTTVFETSIFMQDHSSVDVIDWQWLSPGSVPTSSTSVNPSFTFPDGVVGKYPITLIVETDRGCIDTTTYILDVVEDILFYSPNSFTPDGDEFNQSWKIHVMGIDIYNFELVVFNRWGEIVWETRDPEATWDGTFNGKDVSAGTYVWKANVKSPYNDNKESYTGSINLIR